MRVYDYDAARGKLARGAAVADAIVRMDAIILMDDKEFAAHAGELPRGDAFLRSMAPIRYCKLEMYAECTHGTMRIPKGGKGGVTFHNFGFYLFKRQLYFIGEEAFLAEALAQAAENAGGGGGLRRMFLALLEELLRDDVLYLQRQEEQLAGLEEELLREMPEGFYGTLLTYRKRFCVFHAYYEQLENMGDVMQAADGLAAEEKAQWQLFAARAGRLRDHVGMLREYLVQIRDLYQSLIAVRQNRVTGLLAAVTAVFLPLTLIAGWYGMNFPNMPEFHWKYAYPAVIIVSAAVVAAEIFYFRKKKLF